MSSENTTISDIYEPTLEPIFSFKPIFIFPDGIFSPIERLMHTNGKINLVNISGTRTQHFYNFFLKDTDIQQHKIISEKSEISTLKPTTIIKNFGIQLQKDVSFLNRETYPMQDADSFSPILEGDFKQLWLHPKAKLSPLCVINTTEGSVIIEKGVQVGAFSYLKGPIYIGEETQINRASLTHTRVGKVCRIGGEITHSIIGNFTNKSHEGFLGHSIVGDWVNLGASTTTSNLKNNYGMINLEYQEKKFATNAQKFGSIIGDFCKTAIATILKTGSILDTGSLLFEGRPLKKYYPPFFWGGEQPTIYILERFIQDIYQIMEKRSQKPSEHLIKLIKKKYSSTHN